MRHFGGFGRSGLGAHCFILKLWPWLCLVAIGGAVAGSKGPKLGLLKRTESVPLPHKSAVPNFETRQIAAFETWQISTFAKGYRSNSRNAVMFVGIQC